MKKTILIVGLAVLALGVLGVGAVFAQDNTPPVPFGHGQMMNNGSGPVHTFMTVEFAKALDLNVNDINTRLAAGETMYDIALSAGVTADEFPAIMTEVRAAALAEAVKANVITQEQADWMTSRGTMRNSNCTGVGPQGNYGNGMMGNGYGRGGMMGGWGAGQQTTP
ncbi:MAG: hypothetical protein IH588_17165 [Anaerolineales bacterium]|nr:hypothetical protein [Anaerolineales bacterium]